MQGDSFSCALTASDGTPFYDWTVTVNDGSYADPLPLGLSSTVSPGEFATYAIAGKPTWGTFDFKVTVKDQEPIWPGVTASTSFTLVVNKNPNMKYLQ